MSEHQRCYRCGNLAPWCHCGKVSNLPQGPPPKTRYEKQRDAIVAMETTEFSYSGIGASDYEPTAEDFVLHALGGAGEALYLCRRGCGVTTDHECDYGGWHGAEGHDSAPLHITTDRDA